MKNIFLAILFFLIITVLGCKKSSFSDKPLPKDGVSTSSLIDIIQNTFIFSKLNAALDYTGLKDSLRGLDSATIFVPDDIAFDSIGLHTIEDIQKLDKSTLRVLLKYHILPNKLIGFNDILQKPGNLFSNWDGKELSISRPYVIGQLAKFGDFMSVNGALVLQSDIKASNGLIHILGNVLQYSNTDVQAFLLADTSVSLFVQLLKNFNEFDALNNFAIYTLLVPRNSSFRNIGINEQTVNMYDSLHYSKLLVKPYILPNIRLFSTDVYDFSDPFNYRDPKKSFLVNISAGSSSSLNSPLNVVASGFDSISKIAFPLRDSKGGLFNSVTILIQITSPNYTTSNGVISYLNDVLVNPIYVKK